MPARDEEDVQRTGGRRRRKPAVPPDFGVGRPESRTAVRTPTPSSGAPTSPRATPPPPPVEPAITQPAERQAAVNLASS